MLFQFLLDLEVLLKLFVFHLGSKTLKLRNQFYAYIYEFRTFFNIQFNKNLIHSWIILEAPLTNIPSTFNAILLIGTRETDEKYMRIRYGVQTKDVNYY